MTATALPTAFAPALAALAADSSTGVAAPAAEGPAALARAAAATAGSVPLQASASGGSPVLAALVLAGLAVAAGLALLIAYEALRGYRASRDRAMLYLAVGIVLLTAGPIAIRIAIPTFTDAGASVRVLSATASELLGLACILYAVYGRP